MPLDECTFKVTIRKTVQVKQYEPTTIELSMEGACTRNQQTFEYAKAFKETKAEMNKIFGTEQKSAMDALK